MNRKSARDPYGFVGTALQDYQLEELVGLGGMAVVYRARHPYLGTVAVKVLKPDLVYASPNMVEEFLQEAKRTAALDHAHIVKVTYAGLADDETPFLVMPLLEGRTLQAILEDDGALPVERVAWLFEQICAAVQHAHDNQLIHRDLKPGNVMVVRDQYGVEQVKILDFGIAKALTATANVSRPIGTIHYAAPEQLRRGASLDQRADIYGLGVLLYQMLTATLPFEGDTLEHILYQKLNFTLPPLGQLRPDLPAGIAAVVARALATDPAQRPRRARELARDFQQALNLDTGGLRLECVLAGAPEPVAGAAVYLNGQAAGLTDARGQWRQTNLAPRDYLVEVEAPRAHRWHTSARVQAGAETPLWAELQREALGALLLTCGVAGARVEVDGKQAGLTNDAGRLYLETVEAGTRRVRVTHAQHAAAEVLVELAAGAQALCEVELKPRTTIRWQRVWPPLLAAALLLLAATLFIRWWNGRHAALPTNAGLLETPTPAVTTPSVNPVPSPMTSPTAPAPNATQNGVKPPAPTPKPALPAEPRLLSQKQPDWPPGIRGPGTVTVTILINERGKVVEARDPVVTPRALRRADVMAAATAAAAEWKYTRFQRSNSALFKRQITFTIP